MALVLFKRLEPGKGFSDMADALRVAQKLREQGVDAVAEQAAGSPGEGIMVFYIKVPEEQLEKAMECDLDTSEAE